MMSGGLMFLDHKDSSWDAANHELLMALNFAGKLGHLDPLDRAQPHDQGLDRVRLSLQVCTQRPVFLQANPPLQAQFNRVRAYLAAQCHLRYVAARADSRCFSLWHVFSLPFRDTSGNPNRFGHVPGLLGEHVLS
jgi:hypothetical protein